jgi:4-hydroxy-3-polyprenylbenzoate decarboxylase
VFFADSFQPQYSANLPVVVGITGASGGVLGLELVGMLLRLGIPVDVIVTEKAYQVLLEETGLKLGGGDSDEKASRWLDHLKLSATEPGVGRLRFWANHELDAGPSSGTYLTRGMVIMPCSMGTMARIAAGLSDKLISRAADVTLKSQRRLILVARETPLNAIHLENMLKLSRLGVCIMPPVLSFYHESYLSMDGQIRYLLGKVMDQLGIRHQEYARWKSDTIPSEPLT